jgi:hypothetical protein
MSTRRPIGPCTIFVATTLETPFSQWTGLGKTRGNTLITLGDALVAGGGSDNDPTPMHVDALYAHAPRIMATALLLEEQLAILQQLAPGSVLKTASGVTALAFGEGTAEIVAQAFAFVPDNQYVVGDPWWDSDHTIWIARGCAYITGQRRLQRPQGDDAFSDVAYEVTFKEATDEADAVLSRFSGSGIGRIWLAGVGVLGLDLLHEADSAQAPLPSLDVLLGTNGTHDRDTTATWREAGTNLVKTAAIDTPRIELAADGKAALLMEPQGTNVWTHSEDLSQNVWAKSGVTLTLNAGTDPKGAGTANRLLETNTNAPHKLFDRSITGGTDNTVQAISLFARPQGRDWLLLRTNDKAANTRSSYVNLTTGVIGTKAAEHTIRVRPAANGFWRIDLVFNIGTGASTPNVLAYTALSDGGSATFQGDGTKGVDLWGLDCRLNEPYVSSYNPSGASEATRNADVLTLPYVRTLDAALGLTIHLSFEPLYTPADAVLRTLFRLRNADNTRYLEVYTLNATVAVRGTFGPTGSLWDSVVNALSLAQGVGSEITLQLAAAGVTVYEGDTLRTLAVASGALATQSLDALVFGPDAALLLKRYAVARGLYTPAQMRKARTTT